MYILTSFFILFFVRRLHIPESAHKGLYKFIAPWKSMVEIRVGQMKTVLDRIRADVDYIGFDGGANIMELEGVNTPVYGDPNHVVPHLCWVEASIRMCLPLIIDQKSLYGHRVEKLAH
jgi:hypothetical protein